mmetsp:Transcript_5799/g.17138  ORF Transcript_5799/g.17138 Transcript_5799/m.17138 type:complete len:263 (-) Transcript_5799:24-812(-)
MRSILILFASAQGLLQRTAPNLRRATLRSCTKLETQLETLREEIATLELDLLKSRFDALAIDSPVEAAQTLLGLQRDEAQAVLAAAGGDTINFEQAQRLARNLPPPAPSPADARPVDTTAAWARAAAALAYAVPLAQAAPVDSVLLATLDRPEAAQKLSEAYVAFVGTAPLAVAGGILAFGLAEIALHLRGGSLEIPRWVRVSALQAFLMYGIESFDELLLTLGTPYMHYGLARGTAVGDALAAAENPTLVFRDYDWGANAA